MQIMQKLMSQCQILSEHCVPASSSMWFSIAIHLTVCSYEHKVQDLHKIQTQTTHMDWVIKFLTNREKTIQNLIVQDQSSPTIRKQKQFPINRLISPKYHTLTRLRLMRSFTINLTNQITFSVMINSNQSQTRPWSKARQTQDSPLMGPFHY